MQHLKAILLLNIVCQKNDMQQFYIRFHPPESAPVGWEDDDLAAQEHPHPGVEAGTLNGWNGRAEPAKMRT